jgi:hypothetical protein
VPHLRRWGLLPNYSQPLRAGLTSAAPAALKRRLGRDKQRLYDRIGYPPRSQPPECRAEGFGNAASNPPKSRLYQRIATGEFGNAASKPAPFAEKKNANDAAPAKSILGEAQGYAGKVEPPAGEG